MMQFTNQKLLALLSPLPLIDVLHDPNAIEKLAVFIKHSGRRHSDPSRAAVLTDVSLLSRIVLQFTPHMTGVKLALARSISQIPCRKESVYATSLPDGSCDSAVCCDSIQHFDIGHFVPSEAPGAVAAAVRELSQAWSDHIETREVRHG